MAGVEKQNPVGSEPWLSAITRVGIYRGIIMPGFLLQENHHSRVSERWCRILSIHGMLPKEPKDPNHVPLGATSKCRRSHT